MAITNAQQYQQILQKEREEKAFGGLMGIDGRKAYVGGSYSTKGTSDGKERGSYQGRDDSGGYGGTYSGGGGGADSSYVKPNQEANNTAAIAAGKKAAKKEAEKKEKKKTIRKRLDDYNLKQRKKKQKSILSNINKKIRSGFNTVDPNINLTRSIKEMEMYADPDATYGDMIKEAILEGSTFGNKGDLIGAGFEKYSPKEGSAKEKFNYQPDFFTPIETDSPSLAIQGAATIGNFLGGILANKTPYEGKMTGLADLYDKAYGLDLSKTTTSDMTKDFEPNRYAIDNNLIYDPIRKTFSPKPDGGGGGNQVTDPCKGPNPPAYCFVNNDPTEEDTTPDRNLRGLAPRFGGSIFNFDNLADGGRAGAMDGGRMMNDDDPTGGIMDLESGRQMYFLGKLVKKATRAVKKVAKSPIGKAALLYFGGGALGNLAGGSGLGGMFKGAMTPGQFFTKNKLANVFTKGGAKNILFGGQKLMGNAAKNNFVDFSGILGSGGKFSLGKTLGLSLGVPFALDALGVGKEEEDGFDIDEYYKTQGIDIDAIRNNPNRILARRFMAEGGDAEPVAKKTMPLLDMDGMEKDYREDGGFVPIGRMERADDVPARLSKNEFVFTADAVRNAGEGDIDKGAEVMYNMMKNLESGGEVSEESQGLDGAREMFKTSQRLEEVL